MKTISGNGSLVVWSRNENKSNIYLTSLDGNNLFLKDDYASLFADVSQKLRMGNQASFVKCWSKSCDIFCKNVYNKLKTQLKSKGMDPSRESLQKVSLKFRGNAGEILVEMLAENGLVPFGVPSTYTPVDPDHEEFVDATMKKDDLPVGIQIKNYSDDSNVWREVFVKASAMSDRWLRRDKLIPQNRILDFVSTPCQHIVATCKPNTDLLLEEHKGCVVFHGPEWLDSLKIQGSTKTGEAPMWHMFSVVASEIANLT